MPRARLTPTLQAALVMEAALLSINALPELRGAFLFPFLVAFAAAAAAFAVILWRLPRRELTPRLLFGFAILFRITLWLGGPPTLSDDYYRYLWDGHLLAHGANPYLHAVNSPALDSLTIPARAHVNSPWMSTPYLPAAQALFAALSALAPGSPLVQQAAMGLLDLAAGALLYDLLRRLALPPQAAVLMLWHPLALVEFSHAAHGDAWMIFLAVLAAWLLARGRAAAGGLALAASVLTKVGSGMLLAALWPRLGRRGLIAFAAAALLLLLPFGLGAGWGLNAPLMDGTGVFGALRIYSVTWRYNGFLFEGLAWGLGRAGLPEETAGLVARGVLGLALLVVLAGTAIVAARRETALAGSLRAALWPAGALLLFSPTLHPWYATFLLPWLAFHWGSPLPRHAWGWLAFTLVVPLSYLTYAFPVWHDYPWVRAVQVVPLLAVLALGLLERKQRT